MSQLTDTLEAVKEEGLPKSKLEEYHLALSGFYADLMMQIAGLKKEKAMFEAADPNKSVAKMKVEWKATQHGQRLIELEGYARATSTQLRSLKNRLFAIY